MAPPAAVVDAARAARDQLETQVSASFGAMNRAVNRPGSDFTDLGLQSQVGGYDPPAPYGSGNTAGLPAGVSPNNGGAGGDTAPQVPYLNQPWPVGLPAMVCQIPPSIGGAPASQVFAAPMSAAEYVAPPGTPAPAGIRPLVTPPTQPAAAPPPGQRAASAAMSRLNDLYKAANKAQDDYQAQVRAAIAKADPSGRGRVELVYPGQAPGAPRYAAGYGSPPGTQPAVYVDGRLVMPSRVLPAPGLPADQARGLRGLGCSDCGGGVATSFLGSLLAAGALLVAAHVWQKRGGNGL